MKFLPFSSATIMLVLTTVLGSISPVQAQDAAKNLDDLLRQVESGRIQEAKENRAREQKFLNSNGKILLLQRLKEP